MKYNLNKKIEAFILILCQLFILISISFTCNVEELVAATKNSETNGVVYANELDFGDYSDTMIVGQKQLLTVTVLPVTTTDKSCSYLSEHQEVASVNGLGRITALSAGSTYITVSCGVIKSGFMLTVTDEQEQASQTKPNQIQTTAVTEIELADYNDELYVDKTLNLAATVLPTDATNSQITYKTSNEDIATVSSTGVVKGITPGDVTITLRAGSIVKEIQLHVKVSTVQIKLNSSYLVLKKSNTFQLSGTAIPKEADQVLSYKSADNNIATVSTDGVVTARNIGNTTILVSNGDLSCAVSVIVNEDDVELVGENNVQEAIEERQTGITTEIIQKLQTSDCILCSQSQLGVLPSILLKFLYENNKQLEVQHDKYTLIIQGSDIVNYNNELDTALDLVEIDNGIEFNINEGINIPGKIYLKLNENVIADGTYRYLYKYNDAKNKYEKLKYTAGETICIDNAGQYQLTYKDIHTFSINWFVVGIITGVLVVLIGIYIFIKKRYWFW